MLKKIFNPCNIYFGLFTLYEMHGFLYAKTSLLNKLLVFYILFIGLFHFIKILFYETKSNKLPFIKVFIFFTIFLSCYGIFNIINGSPSNLVTSEVYLKNILISFLPLYSFFYYSKKGYINESWIKYVFIILILLALIKYTQERFEVLSESSSFRENLTNNKGYMFLALMPFLIFWNNNRILQFIFLTFLCAYILMAMKRGAILLGSICMIYFIIQSFKKITYKQKITILLLLYITLYLLVGLFTEYFDNNSYFQNRLESTIQGDSSGRDDIYSSLLDYFFINANFFNLIIGFGPDATIAYYGHYAHQDWLELLINCGFAGIIIYIFFYVSAFKTVKLISNNKKIYVCFIMSILILLGKSMFSMGYESIGLYQGLSLGYCLSCISNYRLINKNKLYG